MSLETKCEHALIKENRTKQGAGVPYNDYTCYVCDHTFIPLMTDYFKGKKPDNAGNDVYMLKSRLKE